MGHLYHGYVTVITRLGRENLRKTYGKPHHAPPPLHPWRLDQSASNQPQGIILAPLLVMVNYT